MVNNEADKNRATGRREHWRNVGATHHDDVPGVILTNRQHSHQPLPPTVLHASSELTSPVGHTLVEKTLNQRCNATSKFCRNLNLEIETTSRQRACQFTQPMSIADACLQSCAAVGWQRYYLTLAQRLRLLFVNTLNCSKFITKICIAPTALG